jgi:UDP-N-acetylmuramate dehydrogenase
MTKPSGMHFKRNHSLKPFNTFGIDVKADLFTQIHSSAMLQELLSEPQWQSLPKLILGQGSNVLLTKDFPGLVIINKIPGISVINEDDDYIWMKIGAGENWHQFVIHCVENNYAGIENLSLIPGTVGAAPMQNIGAYGVELKEVFEELEALDLNNGHVRVFRHEECHFGYRDSIFKNSCKNQFVITSVTLCLNKKPNFNISYGTLQETLEKMQVHKLSIKAISDAVIHIRQTKLPDPRVLGNAGSFFKNPTIFLAQFTQLKDQFSKLPSYPAEDDKIKIPAAWLIEQCGFRGHRVGEIGVHDRQALVIVNYGAGTGLEIKHLAEEIQASVFAKFGITLTPEVNII